MQYHGILKLICLFLIVGHCMQGSNPTAAAIFASSYPTDCFGEIISVQPTGRIQLKFPYNLLNSAYVNISQVGSGTAVPASTNFAEVATGATAGSSAMVTSKYRLNYQPGQGVANIFTAMFTTPGGVAGTTQFIGMANFTTNTTPTFANISDGFGFGYSGTTFGIFKYTNTTQTFIPQTGVGGWNVDQMNGTGPSGMTLDTADGNVYKIQYSWLGFGVINFFIYNPGPTGNPQNASFQLVHVIQYPNANTVTSLLNPSMQLMEAVSNGATTSNVSMQTPCMSGFIEGYVNTAIDERNSAYNTTAVTTPTGISFVNCLSIQNLPTFNSITNQVMVYPDMLMLLNNGASGSDCIFTLYLNPTFTTSPAFPAISTNSVVGTNTTAVYSNTTTPVGTALATFFIPATFTSMYDFAYIDLSDLQLVLAPGDVLSIAASSISSASSVYVSLSWVERF